MPPIWRLRFETVVASSVRIGTATPPTLEAGIGVLIVTTSLLTVLPVRLIPPGTALATQLFVLIQVASTGALVHVWLAAETCRGIIVKNRQGTDNAQARTWIRFG